MRGAVRVTAAGNPSALLGPACHEPKRVHQKTNYCASLSCLTAGTRRALGGDCSLARPDIPQTSVKRPPPLRPLPLCALSMLCGLCGRCLGFLRCLAPAA